MMTRMLGREDRRTRETWPADVPPERELDVGPGASPTEASPAGGGHDGKPAQTEGEKDARQDARGPSLKPKP
jgi:hypothetical protein